jgi:hypothetical protein
MGLSHRGFATQASGRGGEPAVLIFLQAIGRHFCVRWQAFPRRRISFDQH